MKKYARFVLPLIAVALLGLHSAVSAASASATAQQIMEDAKNADLVLKAGHVLQEGSHYDIGLLKFAELVKNRTNGRIVIEAYRNGVLGQERDMIEAMQLGTLDLAMVATAPIGGFLPAMMLMDLPYLFRDKARLRRRRRGSRAGTFPPA